MFLNLANVPQDQGSRNPTFSMSVQEQYLMRLCSMRYHSCHEYIKLISLSYRLKKTQENSKQKIGRN